MKTTLGFVVISCCSATAVAAPRDIEPALTQSTALGSAGAPNVAISQTADGAHGGPDSPADERSAPATSTHRLHWDFPRFRLWEYGVSVAASAYFTYSVLAEPPNIDWSWKQPLPGDEGVRDLLVAKGVAGRRVAKNRSDRLWHIVEFYPFADSIVVPLLFDDLNVDVTWQMTLLNWQGLAVMGAVNRLTHDWIRRDRPALRGCDEQGPEYSHYCGNDTTVPHQSFLSGHAGSVFFGAGATCAHHFAMPLYGHPVADIGICVLGLAAATTTGALRIITDAHWMSDVVAGAITGFGAGWGLAYGLHYATPLRKLQEAGMMIVPIATEKSVELTLAGNL